MFDESFSINEAMFVEREKFRFDFKTLRSVLYKKEREKNGLMQIAHGVPMARMTILRESQK